MRFYIRQNCYCYTAAIHLGTWPPLKYRKIGPEFKTYEAVAAYIRGLKK